MLPLAIPVSQVGGVSLTPFVDDGNTMTHRVPPIIVPLVGAKDLKAATLRIGARSYRLLAIRGPSKPSMFVDRNGDGRGGPNERVVLSRQAATGNDGRPIDFYTGLFTLPGNVRFGVMSFVSGSPDSLRLFPLSGYAGTAKIGPKSYRVGVRGTDLAHGSLFIDRDGDGLLGTVPAEMFALGKPFSLDGRSYRVSAFRPDRVRIEFAPSATRVAEVPMPTDLRVGRVVPPVPGRTLGGKALTFPKSFPGKLVLLDVWATWCGPCKGEIPYMKAAYAKYRSRGFEICSMSIDDPGTQGMVASFTRANGMGWTQVFQGQGWASPVCRRYNITGIPFMLLVDGSTGRILAREDRLRGPGVLEGTVAAALSRRR